MKILTVVGARPQFVKAAVFCREVANHSGIEEIIVHTGQHFDENMSDVFFQEMHIPKPKYNLNIHGLNHGAMTGQMLAGIEEIILKEKPDLLLVYGDTNSTLAGALAARKLHIAVGHVEAGLRSFNMKMPEEINRILTDRISNLLFCPTEIAVENLKREGFDQFDVTISKTGDIMQDAAMYYAQFSADKTTLDSRILNSEFILCTLHRAENTDDHERMKEIIAGLNAIHEKTPVIMPVHPRTAQALKNLSLEIKINLIDPVGYFDMIELLKNCKLVMTDSGGLQKEAFFFGKNCVTIRDQTEWVELVENGFNVLASANANDIVKKFETMIARHNNFNLDLYGNGKAAAKILFEIEQFFGI